MPTKTEKCETLYQELIKIEDLLRAAQKYADANFHLSGLEQEIRSAICCVGIAQRRIKEYQNQ